MGSPWDNRAMLERYLYDYLTKNGMGETAEIFRREANLNFNPMSPPAIDVPDGFLREWWFIFCEMFRARQPMNADSNESSSNMAKQMVTVNQQGEPSQLREQEMIEEMISELTGSSDFGLTTGDNLMSLDGCILEENEKASQGLTSSQPKQESLTDSKSDYRPVDIAGIVAKGVCSSSCATPETEMLAPNESGRKSKNCGGSGYGSDSVPVAADCPSETSSPICKSFNDTVKLSHVHDGDNKDEGKTSSSNSETNQATADTKTSKVKGSRHS